MLYGHATIWYWIRMSSFPQWTFGQRCPIDWSAKTAYCCLSGTHKQLSSKVKLPLWSAARTRTGVHWISAFLSLSFSLGVSTASEVGTIFLQTLKTEGVQLTLISQRVQFSTIESHVFKLKESLPPPPTPPFCFFEKTYP